MRSERLWILLLTLTAFCAGLAAGVLLSFRQRPQESGPFPAFEARMTQAFDLEPERLRNLRYILQDYEEKIESLKDRNIDALSSELVQLGLDHRQLIRTWVVPEHRLQEYDLWVEGLPVLSIGSQPQ